MQRYRIQFPTTESEHLDQDEVTFELHEGDSSTVLRFHDYEAIYERPGLYEQIFYGRLQCQSPAKVARILCSATEQAGELTTTLRVLDLGAGNGIMGEELRRMGAARVVGVDIIDAAAAACQRDRPGLYDDYVVCDLTQPDDTTNGELDSWSFDCLTTMAAIGFGDIPRSPS